MKATAEFPLKREAEITERALRAARDTRLFEAERGIRHRTASGFESLFGSAEAIIVADRNTWEAAGRDVQKSFLREGRAPYEPFLFGSHIYADYQCVQELEAALRPIPAIPIAVGSGTLNDLTKLVAHNLGRPYMVVGTAASMDGYSAFGASITRDGSKNTMDCPGPRAVLADLDVMAAAPEGMNASGYADLMAKVVAGADWILADAAGVEPIDTPAWETVQGLLPLWLGSPEAIAANDPAFLRHLVHGLVLSGFAMQATLSSRPASGAEHQFSHLWDMQHHTFQGAAPSHGFKVGIGVLASAALYEELLRREPRAADIESAVENWPAWESVEKEIRELFGPAGLEGRALDETRAKYVSRDELRVQLNRLGEQWDELRAKLRAQLLPFGELRAMLCRAGCPSDPAQIGISRARLRRSYQMCRYMRRRFTVLDLVQRLGLFEAALDNLFGPHGVWAEEGELRP
jgi:glycerol-1-phosphate dehydrogenase [NAD(P)+]